MAKTENPRWAVISTEALLQRDKKRFYLPHPWNETGPWLDHEVLAVKYEQYKKEKKACMDKQQDVDPLV